VPRSLVDQLYDLKNSEALKALYETDLESRPSIKQAIGAKLITDSSKIIVSNAIDALFMICLTAKFADSEDECNRVAITIYQYHDKTRELIPSLLSDQGLLFASKCLISLSFYPQALEKRWKYHGAPRPDFYRQLSKTVYNTFDQKDIAAHHEQWEMFLGEVLV
jgi:hypothetical protein